jgi:AcrR family transcriptional regulator
VNTFGESMTTREEQREDTRRRLLAAAREQFEAHGFEATGLREVAKAAGVAAGTVFVHFSDKKDLLHAALFEDLEAELDRALSSGPDGLEPWLLHVAGVFFDYYAARPRLSRVLLRESMVAEGEWGARFAGQFTRVHGAVVARYEAARARGEVVGDAAVFALAFISFYTFALMFWVQTNHPDPRGIVSKLVAQHLSGVRP